MMKVIEHNIQSKQNNQELCEDALYIDEHLIAVIDGATSKGKMKWKGMSSGAYASFVICQELKKGIVAKSSRDFFENLDHALCNAISDCNISDLSIEDLPRASVIAYIPGIKEVWCYGDCQCMIGGVCYSHQKIIDLELSEKRSQIISEAIKCGMSIPDLEERDIGREQILDELKQQLKYENRHCLINGKDYGYPVLNGRGICEDMIVCHSVPDNEEIVLASDGYPFLKSSLKESEQELKKILKIDKLCYQYYKSTKGLVKGNASFDDRTYVRIAT